MMMHTYLQNRKGGALVLVIMVMVVLMILGTSLLNVSLAESTLSVRQLNRSQAYFSARSGAEIGLKRIKTAIASGSFQDVQTLYNAVRTPISGSVNLSEDTYNVSFVDGGLVAQGRIKIYAQGMARGVTNTTALTIHFTTPNSMPLDWLNPGQIIRSGFWERTTDPVIVNTAKLLGHSPKKSSTSLTTWRAPSIHFIDNDAGFSLEVTHKRLVLQTNLVSFKRQIFTKDDNDCLELQTFNAQGFRDDSGNRLPYNDAVGIIPAMLIPDGWGVIVVKVGLVQGNNKNSAVEVWPAGYYAFAPGTQISNAAHRTNPARVLKITNFSTIDSIDAVIDRETSLGFHPTHMKWSKD